MNKSCIPNSITLGNLVCGVFSLLCTLNSDYTMAGLFILLGGIFDRYDGTVARFLNTNSELGKELDSLADLVSFGVAPAVLAYSLFNLRSFGILGIIITVIFPVAGAFRLARYNCSEFNNVFTGVPITIAGSLLSILCILATVKIKAMAPVVPMTFMIILAYLMISHFQIKKK